MTRGSAHSREYGGPGSTEERSGLSANTGPRTAGARTRALAQPQGTCSREECGSTNAGEARTDESVCTPGSVPSKTVATISLGPALPRASSDLPAGRGRAIRCLLLGLAPGGVFQADPVTRTAGGLLPHRFTLASGPNPRRSILCGTIPRVTPGGC